MYLVCGEALFDFFLSDSAGPGALTFDARAGGSPFNVAIGIARRGGRSALLTGLSEDLLGRRLAEVLDDEGVETRYLVRSGRRTTVSLVDLSTAGQPSYAFYGVGSADTALEVADLPTVGEEITGLHFGSYSIAASPVADAFHMLAQREAHRFISLDPNIRITVEPDLDVWRGRIDALLPFVNVVKASAEDLDILYPATERTAIAAEWLAKGPSLVVITDGGDHVSAFTPSERVDIEPPRCNVVDTVGAGDAFQATMLAELGRDGNPLTTLTSLAPDGVAKIIAAAADVAAQTCARRGADIPRI